MAADEVLVLVGTAEAAGYVRVVSDLVDRVFLPEEARELARELDELDDPEFRQALLSAADEAERLLAEKKRGGSSFTSRVGRKTKPALKNPDRRAILRRAMRGT